MATVTLSARTLGGRRRTSKRELVRRYDTQMVDNVRCPGHWRALGRYLRHFGEKIPPVLHNQISWELDFGIFTSSAIEELTVKMAATAHNNISHDLLWLVTRKLNQYLTQFTPEPNVHPKGTTAPSRSNAAKPATAACSSPKIHSTSPTRTQRNTTATSRPKPSACNPAKRTKASYSQRRRATRPTSRLRKCRPRVLGAARARGRRIGIL